MHIKKLASTLMKKNLIVTFTVVTAISLGILTGCGAYQQASADPLTQPTTQIEQMVEDEHQETEASGDVSGNETQESTQETTENTQESSTESSTQEETQDENQDNTVSYHTETQTIHHAAVTHTEQQLVRAAWDETVVDQAAWDETVVDKAAWDETVTTYTTETQTIHHDGQDCETCCDCGAQFTDHGAALAHIDSTDHSGLVSDRTSGWDETVTVQVPHNEVIHHEAVTHIVHHEAVTHVVHHEAEYKTVTIVDREAWDEEVEVQVPNN